MNAESYNPDVLTCIANLSSDEVFTPPQLVNRMLDLLPPQLWSDPDATFLDPGCKSGVFLREIAERQRHRAAARDHYETCDGVYRTVWTRGLQRLR